MVKTSVSIGNPGKLASRTCHKKKCNQFDGFPDFGQSVSSCISEREFSRPTVTPIPER